MIFEFDYNTDAEQITIVYEGSCVLIASFDGEKLVFKNFDRVNDDDIENMLKNLCKAAFEVLG
jgi:hypothetical protein